MKSKKDIRPEKLRDMVRSILPSRYRRAAREAKAGENRRVRHAVRRDLHAEDLETTAADLLRDTHMLPITRWRRYGDKLNHFIRWCSAITRGMPTDRALAFVRQILPRNVIGDHAFFHWESHLAPRFSAPAFYTQRKRDLQSFEDKLRHRLRRALAIDPDLLGRLNAQLKEARAFDEGRRLLLGVHDIDAFVHELLIGSQTEEQALRHGWTDRFTRERWIVVRAIAEVEIADGPKRRVEREVRRL